MKVSLLLPPACLLLFTAIVTAQAPPASAQTAPATDDLFDISQGTQIIRHTKLHTISDIRNMFGGSFADQYLHEAEYTIFDDRLPQGTVHSVEWQTASP